MEKRILVAALLSAIFLTIYSKVIGDRYAPQQSSSTERFEQQSVSTDDFERQAYDEGVGSNKVASSREIERYQDVPKMEALELDDEDVVSIESSVLTLEIGKKSGAIRSATLKEFKAVNDDFPIRFGSKWPIFSARIADDVLSWRLLSSTYDRVTFEATDNNKAAYTISYQMDQELPVVHIDIQPAVGAPQKSIFLLRNIWANAHSAGGRYSQIEQIALRSTDQEGKFKHYKHNGRLKHEKIVPRGTILLTLSEQYFCQSIRFPEEPKRARFLENDGEFAAIEAAVSIEQSFSTELYIGPRDYFYLNQAGFGRAFPIGMFGQIGLILLAILDWIAGIVHNYGIAIILFSILVTCATAPFTMMSFKSMKKMQELKPQVDQIMAQHKSDPKKANQHVFALYKENRVSPISGCLPMLLPFPIFIALFQAIPHFIKLRGESFLWIADLSQTDKLATLPFTLPIIGSDFNLLPIIMAFAMYAQSRLSQKRMATDESNPMAKMMSGPFMSILFGFMFYSFPSSLVLYWLTNSLMSMLWYRLART